jgi:FAD/FMN-containing dehydrogenase
MTETNEIEELGKKLRGRVITSTDSQYEEARAVWNGVIDRYPQMIVRCTSDKDVIEAVNFARERDLLVAVRGGGHNVAGHGTCDGGMVIDMSSMRRVEVDPGKNLVRAEGGATLGDVDAATQACGLAVPLGVVSETGIAGLTLGGGMGHLRNKYGLSCDSLLGAEVVTAEGRLVKASEEENRDLLWGLRGGGGNFGIVTSFTYRAYPLGPEVYFLSVFHPGERAGEALQLYREFTSEAPEEVSVLAFLGIIPEGAEGFPEKTHGRPFAALVGMHSGSVAEGDRLLRPLREFGEPLADFSGPTPYVDLQRFFDEEYPDGDRYYWKSISLDHLNDRAIDRIVEHARRQPSPFSTTDVWSLGGEIKRVSSEESAFGGRQAAFLLNPEANWKDTEGDEANIRWARDFVEDMQPFSDGSRYLNFAGFQEEGDAMMHSAFGAHYERLAALKEKYDATNFFRLNQNIKPRSGRRATASEGRRRRKNEEEPAAVS